MLAKWIYFTKQQYIPNHNCNIMIIDIYIYVILIFEQMSTETRLWDITLYYHLLEAAHYELE